MKITSGSTDAQDATDSSRRLESLFEDAHREILATLFYVVGNLEDAHDALQETFLKCWRHRDQIERVVDLRAWVFRIAINTGRDCRKAAWNRRRQSIVEESLVSPKSEPPVRGLIREEEVHRLQQAVMRLRAEEQEVFLLRQNGAMSYEQIAEITSIPLGTVKTRMRSAIRHLRESVGGESVGDKR
jgi:RNA polymerase sigma-70 factor (ECF subfamily)